MNKTGETQIEEAKMLDVRSAFKCFVKKLTLEQHRLLKLGQPDKSTRLRLAKMCIDLILCLSNDLIKAVKDFQGQTEHRIFSKMGSMFIQTFSEFMDVTDRCASVEELTTLILREVRDIINSALYSLKDSEEPVKTRITPPKRINAMVKHAIKILKEFGAKIKSLCTSLPRSKRGKLIVTEDVEEDIEDEVKIKDWFQTKSETPSSSSETSIKAVSQAVQKVIGQELNQIVEPISDELSDTDFSSLQTESSREISIVSDDVAKLIVEESHSLKLCGSASPTPEIQEDCIMCIDRILSKIKTFFAKTFAKSSIHYMWAHLRKDLKHDLKKESEESIRSLIDSAKSIIRSDTDGKDEGDRNACVFLRYKIVFSDKIPEIMQGLTDLFYSYLRRDAPIDVSVYTTIKNRVCCYLGLTNWWLNSEVSKVSEKVILSVMETLPLVKTMPPKVIMEETGPCVVSHSVCEEAQSKPQQVSKWQTKKRKTQLRVVLEMVVTQAYSKAKVSRGMGKSEEIIDHLLQKTWPELEGIDFDIRGATFKLFSEAIFRKVYETSGSPSHALMLLQLRDPQIEECIILFLKQHVTQPPKQYSTSNFCSAVRKVIKSVFTQKNKDSVT
ncbi:hypothetical protein Q5P01_003334 [Channa striata]|uniref:Uncharacterized protein n=1 Tax=Channa striata TaxID=64152 RepID=A0AA88NGX9_CHASR|nr:hypothetical protein Q5P01_003334 [Channa striata]